ncbi:geranyllinalool synthase [Artemisia annua]|uniref:Geranyllinalool synthase n=1 Tax=Artemisia annua TaxID=35608 RepID=A0A2U1KAV1_ARTAN|nr:geranyllinalool synthase [Artemisia annua]
MEHSLASIQVLVTKLKSEIFSKQKSGHLHSFMPPSAYDTAWLAMILHPQEHNTPLFKGCLEWLLHNQKEEGYWGDLPTIDALPATLACMAALQKWGFGVENIEKGLKFIHENMEEMLHGNLDHLPRSFSIVFPATIELAESSGLELKLSDHMISTVSYISNTRQQILGIEEMVDKWQYPPLLAYLETFQFTKHNVDQQTIMKHLSEDGSLFQSPSATAQAYISTRNHKCLEYLMTLVHMCPNGVPQKYPMDEELVELSMVDQLQKLGLSEYFIEEIENILKKVYRSYMEQESQQDNLKFKADKIYKDSLAFRLFRLHGWSKKWGLIKMGFGREKTLYCYFAVAASTALPHDSIIRMLVAKSAIVITVADDFFDMIGTLEELHLLVDAIYRYHIYMFLVLICLPSM